MKMTTRGRVTIPKHPREECGLKPGDEVELVPLEDGIQIQKRRHPVDEIFSTVKLEGFAGVDEYIDEIRGSADLP